MYKMAVDKSLVSGSTMMLILKLLEEKDMYGYEMIETLREKSENVFELKAGTLYPLLHGLEEKEFVKSYEQESGMSGNRIEANYVHHFARRLYDAGGLYTLSNQPSSVMRNNRIEHLIDAPYATNDRAFYIYFDEATDGYTVENNWCPSERFDSNRPGPHNVWKKNGPQVDESIKQKAGRVAVGGVSQPRIIIKTK